MAEFDSESNSFVNAFSALRVLSHPERKVTLLEDTSLLKYRTTSPQLCKQILWRRDKAFVTLQEP